MKNRIKILFSIVLFILSIAGCKKNESVKPSNVSFGNVTFWNDEPAVGKITVNISGNSDFITASISPSSCGNADCANFSLSYGKHSYTASATTGETWSGSFTVNSDCLLFNLYK